MLLVAAKGARLHLSGPLVIVRLSKALLQVPDAGLCADRPYLPRLRLLLLLLQPFGHPPPPQLAHVSPAPRGCLFGGPWGGGPVSARAWAFPFGPRGVGGGSTSPPLNVNGVSPPPLPYVFPTRMRMASHATSTHSAFRCSHPTTAASGRTMAAVTVPYSPIPVTTVCTRQCPLTSR